MKTVNYQMFFKNVKKDTDKISFLIYHKNLSQFDEQLIADLTHVNFRIYGHKSPFLATLSHVLLDKDRNIDEIKFYENIDFVITDDEDVAICARLSGACLVESINQAIAIAQENNLEKGGIFRIEQYERAYEEIMSQKQKAR